MTVATLQQYAENIRREHATGQATEHSYRDSLKHLLLALEAGLTVINEPKRIEAGAPDYIIERSAVPVGHIEAKDVDVNLDRLDRRSKEQLQRYLAATTNLIHTNYLDFRWYVNGEMRESVTIGELKGGKLSFNPDAFEDAAALLNRFLNTVTATIDSPRELAEKMAQMAREIKRLIVNSLPDSDMLKAEMAAFEATLIPNLTADDFADMYAQTLAYGLFAARTQHKGKPETFTLRSAFWNLPQTNPFLRRFFQDIVPELDERVSWQVDILANLLAHADIDDILRDFGRRTRQEDPVVHFYETFLREYDPKKRERRGVYYTPEPIVSYIVRSVDYLLRTRFNRTDGLAESNTYILDPATGTGTFLYFVIQHIYESLKFSKQPGMWQDYVQNNLLPRIFGFELLMAPYAVAHMKLGLQLQQFGYKFEKRNSQSDLSLGARKGKQTDEERLGIYLTNTLEDLEPEGQKTLGIAQFITEESIKATEVKRDKEILVVLGNPPYSNFGGLNKGKWISDLMKDWKPEGERKWNPDDFMKFIRFGQWRIEKMQQGILAFITANTYIDGITHRKMRTSLMNSFNDIYVLDLHGSAKKGETEIQNDQNVFDIQQGVAITIFVKEAHKDGPAKVHFAELIGEREKKYDWLNEHDLQSTEWVDIWPKAEKYFFVPRLDKYETEYKRGISIKDIFIKNTNGIQTGRDEFVSKITKREFDDWISFITDPNNTKEVIAAQVELPKWNGFKLDSLRNKLRNEPTRTSIVSEWLYRPFDVRPLMYDSSCIKRTRGEVMGQLLNPNLALITVRQQAIEGFRHVFVTEKIGDGNTISLKTREYNTYCPLYLYLYS